MTGRTPAVAVLATVLALAGCQGLPGSPSAPAGSGAPPAGLALRVTRVADGDTFTGTDPAGAKVKVRVLAIDAPELAHDGQAAACGSVRAADRLRSLILGKAVTVLPDPASDPVDVYGRRLGYVDLAGSDVGLQLVTEGLVEAWYPRGEPRPGRFDAYAAAQRTAKKARAGSWSTCPELGR